MHQIVYTSKATNKFNAVDLVEIVQVAARDNPSRDITGFLLFRNGTFMQLIEGPRENLMKLLDKLGSDPRHTDIRIEMDMPISQRHYPNWKMKRLPADSSEAVAELNAENATRGTGSVPGCVGKFLDGKLAA